MRIVEIAGSATGGVRAHLADVLHVLSDQQLAVLAPAEMLEYCQRAGCLPARNHPVSIGALPSIRDLATLRQIRRFARGADVVHAHTLRAGAYAAHALDFLARPPRLVVTAHNLPQGTAAVRGVGQQLARLVARRADMVLAVSPDIVTWMHSLGASSELAVIPAKAAKVPARLPAVCGSPVIVTVARLSYQKGLDRLLQVAAALRDEFPRLTWLVVGGGPLHDVLAAEIARQHLPVRLCGQVSDVAGYLHVADLVVQTARWEGQPVAIQEALHAGCAIVATDVGGTAAVLGDEIPAVAPSELTAHIAALLRDPKARRQRAQAAKRRSKTLPDLADLRAQLLRTLR